eukprot:NODE_1084_length_1588_cov_6.095517_g54_i1.p4 GENE.NODE_1084_length_1588_cov_6.095517_g54_i1~~NODE_1084_length_1588_cov_6.095517_g54_i1.p4  ORF type:complete len:59 (-),score=0.74 NODE_1084_length_1588_cov_6.095517_g54_i1:790-966(-)
MSVIRHAEASQDRYAILGLSGGHWGNPPHPFFAFYAKKGWGGATPGPSTRALATQKTL